ncbi:hypothetical protein HH304_21040 [Flammeovirgaceae bacterium KN852]|uniref:Uncharacterized protein n=1 Tax=Marinigracilibium pacificum TaxID=2729599 RepID=A0A848J953_9BACT|nr:hypothetical protein [Marinigracilibium pacificum]
MPIPATSTTSVFPSPGFGLQYDPDIGTGSATSSNLMASICSFCPSVQTPQSGLLQFQNHF